MALRHWRCDQESINGGCRFVVGSERVVRGRNSVHLFDEGEAMRLATSWIPRVCVSLSLIGAACTAGYLGNESHQPLSAKQEAEILGGALFTSTECQSPAGAGGCPAGLIPGNVGCGTTGPGGICPGTGFCKSIAVNWSCVTISTNNPFDWACAGLPATACDRSFRVCDAATGTCSVFTSGPNPVVCGTNTRCQY